MLDSSVQPLMLGKVAMYGLGLTNVNFKPCPYQIFDVYGWIKKGSKDSQAKNGDLI